MSLFPIPNGLVKNINDLSPLFSPNNNQTWQDGRQFALTLPW